jgi:uncharacterized protein (TIGR03437 family)
MLDSRSTTIGGVQFDVRYDNTAMSLNATLGDTARNSGKLLYQADLAPNQRRFLIVGLNTNSIADGSLLNLFVNLNPNVQQGVFTLSFSNTAGTDPYGVLASVVGSGGTVTVQGTRDQSIPLQTAGVLNGASLASGPVAPGEIFTLLGSSIGPISTGGGAQVLFDGVPALLSYAAPNQINGVTPYELVGHAITNLTVSSGERKISDLTIPVVTASPAIFTLDGSGVGPGAILNQDSRVNSVSNPAGKGTIVALFATGSGQTDPPGIDGQIAGSFPSMPVLPKPVLPVSVKIGGLDADILYAGAAPGLLSGILQVNCRIPESIAPGYSVPVILTIGSASSPPTVTLAVQ